MASFAVSATATWMGRVLDWLFPSRRAVAVAAAVEVAASLVGLPLPAHVLVELLTHLLLAGAP